MLTTNSEVIGLPSAANRRPMIPSLFESSFCQVAMKVPSLSIATSGLRKFPELELLSWSSPPFAVPSEF